jgi:ABC-type multidrug transport system fused ATPase/permease subunit
MPAAEQPTAPGPNSAHRAELELAALGTGSAADRMGMRVTARLFRRCLPYLRPVKWHLAALTVAGAILLPALVVLGYLAITIVWNGILAGEPLDSAQARFLGMSPAELVEVGKITPGVRSAIARRLFWWRLIPLALPLTALFLALAYYQLWILQRINQQLRVEMMARLQALSLRFHSDSRVGDAVYRLYQDSGMVTQLIQFLFLIPLRAALEFAVALWFVFWMSPPLGLLLLGVWVPAALIASRLGRPLRVGFRGAREANSALTSRIQETLAGIKVIKAYGIEEREQGRFERDSRRAFDEAYHARRRLAAFGVWVFFAVGAALVAASTWAALVTRAGEPVFYSTIAGASAAIALWNLGNFNFFKERYGAGAIAIRTFFRTWGVSQDIGVALHRVFELLDLEPEVRDAPGALPAPATPRHLAFDGVSFRYQPDRPVLEGIDLEVEAGQMVAIVGPTGAGKSTLFALLLRLFDPDAGRILLDGHDLRELSVRTLRERVALALQENVLFGMTVRENIRYAVPDASPERVEAAARVACAHEFITRLPRGYDTPLGERGTKLSTGQRQRLTIARAVLKDAPILVLDEPTASLDAETEIHLLDSLARWGRGRMVFLVTHRLGAARRADRIVCLREGRIVETGSHDSLLGEPTGLYRRWIEADGARVP